MAKHLNKINEYNFVQINTNKNKWKNVKNYMTERWANKYFNFMAKNLNGKCQSHKRVPFNPHNTQKMWF